MKAIILAGGMGTRLRSVVPDLPKPMAPIAGRPFLEYLIDRLIEADFIDLTLSVGYRSEVIRDHFGDTWGGATISYAVETEPLGTGGAIALATRGWTDGRVLVLNGDTYLGIDYRKIAMWTETHISSPFAMVLEQVEDVSRYGAVLCEAGIVRAFTEKGIAGPGLINAGIYVLDPAIFKKFGLTGRFSLETDLLQAHLDELHPHAFVTASFFIDIGIPEDFARAQIEIPKYSTCS